MATRSEILAESAAIRRYATVAAIKRKALGLTAFYDQPVLDLGDAARWLIANGEAALVNSIPGIDFRPTRQKRARRPRPFFVFPPKYARALQACRCLRTR